MTTKINMMKNYLKWILLIPISYVVATLCTILVRIFIDYIVFSTMPSFLVFPKNVFISITKGIIFPLVYIRTGYEISPLKDKIREKIIIYSCPFAAIFIMGKDLGPLCTNILYITILFTCFRIYKNEISNKT
jgi:hypothetical protein